MAQSTELLQNILSELRALRQQIQSKKPSNKKSKPMADSTYAPICWYHNKYGIDALPINCPGIPNCHFDLKKAQGKLQAKIDRISKAPKPSTIQKRIHAARSATNCTKIAPNPITTAPAQQTDRTYTPATPPNANWSEQIETELDKMDTTQFEPLEDQLANLSD